MVNVAQEKALGLGPSHAQRDKPLNEDLAAAVANSPLNQWAFDLLSNVPGLPPIIQAIHILGIAAVMASSVLIDLRLLGLAVRSQEIHEMVRRLMPWTWAALAVNLTTGLPFVLARPYRYFLNPVFAWKVAFLIPAIALAALIHHRYARARRANAESVPAKPVTMSFRVVAAASLLLWIGVILAGRWIAYSDYLFWPQ